MEQQQQQQQQQTTTTKVVVVHPPPAASPHDQLDQTPRFSQEDIAALQTCANTLATTSLPVAFPTETVYGLGANALKAESVRSIYEAKGRPSDNPLIVHVSSMDMVRSLLPLSQQSIPEKYIPLLKACWPGPLTILLPRGDSVPDEVTAGHSTVAVRMPAHPIARALIDMCGFPLAAPSANTSGRPSPTRAAHVLEDLGGRIPLILDGGECSGGVESTVVDGLRDPPVILRPGGITVEYIKTLPGFENVLVFKRDFVDDRMEQCPVTPGMKYKHYSPRMSVILFEPRTECGADINSNHGDNGNSKSDSNGDGKSSATMLDRIATEAALILEDHSYKTSAINQPLIGILRTSHTTANHLPLLVANRLGIDVTQQQYIKEHFLGDANANPASVAKSLFHGLRTLEAMDVACILVEGVSEEREGLAVMNRLRKAATRILL